MKQKSKKSGEKMNFDQFDTNFEISSSDSDNDRKPKIVDNQLTENNQMSHKNYLLNKRNKEKSYVPIAGNLGLEKMI